MEKLDKNWFVEQLVDFEYKKYILLAYLQNVQGNFREHKLYPHLSELVLHYKNLSGFLEQKKMMNMMFPEELTGIDKASFTLSYRKVISDDSLMAEIANIVEYSIPRIKHSMETGRSLMEEIADSMTITPVGIMPLYKEEGYMLIRDGAHSGTDVYMYRISLYNGEEQNERFVHTTHIDSFSKGIVYTAEHIKNVLIRKYRNMPNPATYYIESTYIYPLRETFMPIASSLLSRRVCSDKFE